jgi:hypothetical protein
MAEFKRSIKQVESNPGEFMTSVDRSKAAEREQEKRVAGALTQFGVGVGQGFTAQRLIGDASTFEEAIDTSKSGTEANRADAKADINTLSDLARARASGLDSKTAQIKANALIKNAMNQNPLFADHIKQAGREFLGFGLGSSGGFLSQATPAEEKLKNIAEAGREAYGEIFDVWLTNSPDQATRAVQTRAAKVAASAQAEIGNDLGVDYNVLPKGEQEQRASGQLSLDMQGLLGSISATTGITAENWPELSAQIENLPLAERNRVQVQLQTMKNRYLAEKKQRYGKVDATFFAAVSDQFDVLMGVADGSMNATTGNNLIASQENAYWAGALDQPEVAALWAIKKALPQGISLDPSSQKSLSQLTSSATQKVLSGFSVRTNEANNTDLHNTNLEPDEKTDYIKVIKDLISDHDNSPEEEVAPETNEQYSEYVLDIFKGMGSDEAEASVMHELFNTAASMDFDRFERESPEKAEALRVNLRSGITNYFSKVTRDLESRLANVDPDIRNEIGLDVTPDGRIMVVMDEQNLLLPGGTATGRVFKRNEEAMVSARSLVGRMNRLYKVGDLVRAASNVLQVDAQELVDRIVPLPRRKSTVVSEQDLQDARDAQRVPEVGEEVNGFFFLGGDPNNAANWEDFG